MFNINGKQSEKADRLEKIKIKLKIPASLKDKIEFVSWDKIATETITIDLGKIIGGNSTTVSFSPEIGMSGTIQGKLAGSVSNSKTFSEEKVFSEKIAGLNAALVSKDEFEINRFSMPNENLSGNIVVELSLKAKNQKQITYFDFEGLYNGTAPVTDLSKIFVNKASLFMPDFGSQNDVPVVNIPLELSYDFRFRKVSEGKNTIPEYDDIVKYINGSVIATSPVILSDSETWETKLWYISVGDLQLHIQKADMPVPALLSFTSYEKAEVLMNWIKKTKSLKVSDYSFYLATDKLKSENIKDLEIQIK